MGMRENGKWLVAVGEVERKGRWCAVQARARCFYHKPITRFMEDVLSSSDIAQQNRQ